MRVLHKVQPRRRIMSTGKKQVVPNACMSLEEMLRRFVRREQLPVEKQGVYVETDYDLEKVAKMDRVEQDEILQELKVDTAKKKAKAEKAVAEKAAKDKAIEEARQSDPQVGHPPVD